MKILLFGNGPLPGTPDEIVSATGLRTLQFMEPLRTEHELFVILIEDQRSARSEKEGVYSFSRQDPALFKKSQDVLRKIKPDLVIGVNTFSSYVAAKILDDATPFWADLNGWIMAEMQAQSYELGHNEYLSNGWEQEKTILLRADAISTVSTAQRFAVMGEFAALGRLNKEHFREEIVHVIPNAVLDMIDRNDITGDSFLKGINLPKNAFVVTQIGGFNNWVDEKNLFEGVEMAMQKSEQIHFVSSGGKIPHIAENVFMRFEERIRNSKFRERFHLLGWIRADDIGSLYRESDAGVMADIFCAETETGARNRLNEMLRFGLPIIATRGSEIVSDIERWKCGEVVESGNPESLAAAILRLKENEKLRAEYSRRSQDICRTFLTFPETTRPLHEWILKKRQKNLLHRFRTRLDHGSILSLKSALAFFRERGMKAFFQKIRQHLRRKRF